MNANVCVYGELLLLLLLPTVAQIARYRMAGDFYNNLPTIMPLTSEIGFYSLTFRRDCLLANMDQIQFE